METGASLMPKSYETYDCKSSHNRTHWTMNIGHNVRMIMAQPKDRLKQARIAAGYDTPTDAAKAIRDINRNTLTSHENGNRDISRKAAERYAHYFDVSAGWLLYGEEGEEARTEYRIPVVSMVSAGRLTSQQGITPTDVERYISVDDLPNGDWIALTVDGDSMNRIAPDQSTIIVNRADDTLIDGKYYVFSIHAGDATFKTYKRNPERLQPFSTNPDHMSVTLPDDVYVVGRVRRVIQDV